MKRIPKIIAAALATVALSASLVLAAGAGSPKTANDSLPANCPASGAAMPMQGSHMMGAMMNRGTMSGNMMKDGTMNGRMSGASMMNAANTEDEHKGGHGGGHNRAAAMGQMASLERI